jgi:hypothetical protein
MFKDNDGLEKHLKSITDNINKFGEVLLIWFLPL